MHGPAFKLSVELLRHSVVEILTTDNNHEINNGNGGSPSQIAPSPFGYRSFQIKSTIYEDNKGKRYWPYNLVNIHLVCVHIYMGIIFLVVLASVVVLMLLLYILCFILLFMLFIICYVFMGLWDLLISVNWVWQVKT